MKRPSFPITRSSIALWLIITGLLILVALSIVMRRDTTPLEMPPEKAQPVHVMNVATRSVSDLIQLPGRIEPELRARLAVDKGGRVTELHAEKGEQVVRGQLLLRIDDRTWRALLENAEIEFREAEKEFRRWTELADAGAVSASEFDVVRTRLDRARVQLEDARIHVEQCEVRSPADGVINDRYVEIGEFAAEGAAVLELVVSDPVKLVVDIPERDIHAVGLDDRLSFHVSTVSDTAFSGTVKHIAEAASPANNSYRVEVTVPNEARTLRPGMIATAQLLRARRDEAVVVPLSAVIPRRGEHYVYVTQNDRAVRRLVKIDRILGADVILASGLEAGDELIYDGHRELSDGALIQRIPAEDTGTDHSPSAARTEERASC